jgi:O-antigen ligase
MNTIFINKITSIITIIFLASIALTEATKNISLFLLLLLFIYQIFKNQTTIIKDKSTIFLLLHFLVVIFGIFFGVNAQETISKLDNFFMIFATFIIFKNIYFNITLKTIILTLFIGFIISAIYGLFRYLNFDYVSHIKLGSVGSINRSAVYMVYIFIISISLYQYLKNNSIYNIITIITVILSGLLIIWGGSRMAMFSIPIIWILYLFLEKKLTLLNILKFAIPVVILVIFLLFTIEDLRVLNKINQGLNDTARIQIWLSSIYIWIDHNIFFGIGSGNSIYFSTADFFQNSALEEKPIDNAHNVYLDMLLERGIFGLITFLAFLYYCVKDISPNFRKIGILLAFSLLLMGLANITFRYEFALLFVIIVGVLSNKSLVK